MGGVIMGGVIMGGVIMGGYVSRWCEMVNSK
jgi:hypothetical protein